MTQIRWANTNDVATIAPLFDAYRQFYEKPADLPLCVAFLTARLERGESKVAVAEMDGVAVVFVLLYLLFSSLALSLDNEKIWLLNDLFVAPAGRGLGVGAALLGFSQDFARDSGADYLMLETAKTNLTAQRLYEKQGWLRENEFFVYLWR